MTHPLLKTLEEKYIPEPMSGCWIWIGSRDGNEYGLLYRNGRQNRAHRLSYEIYKSKIPDGLVIDHLCRNHSCINPHHLEAVTSVENVRRNRGQKIFCKKGHILRGKNVHEFGSKKLLTCRTCLMNYRKEYYKKISKGPYAGKLSSEQVLSIRKDNRKLRIIAAEHNISIYCVWTAKNGITYKNLSGQVGV